MRTLWAKTQNHDFGYKDNHKKPNSYYLIYANIYTIHAMLNLISSQLTYSCRYLYFSRIRFKISDF